MRPQVLVQNVFNISDLVVFEEIINQPGTLFIQNIFRVSSVKEASRLYNIIVEAPNIMMSKIQVGNQDASGSTYVDIVKGQVAQGFTPMTWLTTQIFDTQDLPEGSLQHLLECKEEVRPRLKEFFKEFADVLPAELPKQLPPERGLKDVHTRDLYPESRPPNKPAYR